MRNIILTIIAVGTLGFSACKKSTEEGAALSSITVVNAVVNGKVARINSSLRDSVAVNNYKFFTLLSGAQVQIKAHPTATPNAPYFSQTADLLPNGLYSLFLMGAATAPEGVFVKDNIPAFATDSVINIRVVNCSYTSTPIDVNLSSEPTVKQFSNIAYKSVSDFKAIPYKTKRITGDNVFQIKDASGNLLASYTLPLTGTISVDKARFKNITLVFKGMTGGTGANALGVFVMPHYQ